MDVWKGWGMGEQNKRASKDTVVFMLCAFVHAVLQAESSFSYFYLPNLTHPVSLSSKVTPGWKPPISGWNESVSASLSFIQHFLILY